MIGRNPKTGAPIKIMKSDVSIWKNNKTLVYKTEGPSTKEDYRWNRYDLVVSGCSEELMAWKPHVVVLTSYEPLVEAWLETEAAKKMRFILISSKVIDAIGDTVFQGFGLGNVLCLEEFPTMFPYLGGLWDGSVEDAVLCAALVFRYVRLIGVNPRHSRMLKLELAPRFSVFKTEDVKIPEPLVLIQQYYKPTQAKRQKELDRCLKKNLENPLIDKIILFMESNDIQLPRDEKNKIQKVPLKSRLTYADCIEAVRVHVGAGSIVAFANTDIYLDPITTRTLWSIDLHDTVLALLRYEDELDPAEAKIFGPRADSQDTWILHSDNIMDRTWKLDSFRIPFGQAGCDNAILVEFLRAKFRIVNPASSIRTFHVHKSEIRNYDPRNIVDRPVYMYVEPTGVHELDPIYTWTGWADKVIPYEPLARKLNATNPKMLLTFVAQMNRNPDFVWSAFGANEYVPPVGQDRQIDISGGSFVSPSGLVYGYSKLFVGSTEAQKKVWSENAISHLMPAQQCESMMAFPLDDKWVQDPSLYTLFYLSRVLLQKKTHPTASFWCKKSQSLLPSFNLFKWPMPGGNLLHHGPQTQAFAETIVGRTAYSVRIQKPEIDALRSSLVVPWTSTVDSSTKNIVLVRDSAHIKDVIEEDLRKIASSLKFTVRLVEANASPTKWQDALEGASHIVVSTSEKNLKVPSWASLWMAPKDASVLELQEDREPSDELVHLAAAGDLKWTLLQYSRSTADGFRKFVVAEFTKWLEKESGVTVKSEEVSAVPGLPIVSVPPKSMRYGFFGHKGDSFRELVDLWSERGFVQKKEDASLTLCWLGPVGTTLLYDRPTYEWLERTTEKELEFKMLLAGNPVPLIKKSKPWIFWARQPRLVESLVEQGVCSKGYDERTESLVFYGRIENDKQGQHRQNVDGWKSLCSQFSMPVGSQQAYALSPEEYLKALANSRFGLSLRGYGPKCNREIELVSMGCVPVVTEGVDMDNYCEPFVKDTHYLRTLSPEDAEVQIKSVTAEKWQEMSTACREWWKRNASAEGSWNRTKVLANI